MANLKVGIQLYSLRDKMEADMYGTLKAVKEMGYDCVEFAGYFGKSAEEIRGMLDELGLECISVHQTIDWYEKDGVDAVNYVKALGAKYSAIPWYKVEEYHENWDATIEKFSKVGKLLAENGLYRLYNNHDFDFQKINGELIIDKLYSEVSSDYLNPEFDTCWVKYAGYSPEEYLDKYAGRINVVHIKDFWAKKLANGPVYALIDSKGEVDDEEKKEETTEREFEFRPVGSGIQDVKSIVEASIKAGAGYIIVEQDQWYEGDNLADAKKSREYLKSIGY
ncbi:MAG: sugar phosphate isomerase/epimerase [Clostridia bacterium]|nr:sugar phosphate isomerase/epimerase [Clostridia bacterium]